ncbi:hypothetical protein [Streptantibioticus ferralitis]|uniref:HPt domain-containing protein n=1 Tax=Streptantibioticus ferralitis TaxID=236510 RepID=A0ABT5YUX7_9ACTN|nr:hypothetical protein [Streptantibioticus ferralitis]MDF2255359.1 hypothetical protein [Streptantibioticus ferralitis]
MPLTFDSEGQFAHLMHSLRSLAGAEALLMSEGDIPALEYLLALVGRRAEDASQIARLLLVRLQAAQEEGD